VIFGDLAVRKGTGSPYDKLEPLSGQQLAKLSSKAAYLPMEYLAFLGEVGWGELGDASFMLYSGPVDTLSISGVIPGLMAVALIGDDFAGCTVGLSASGEVMEFTPDGEARRVASGFAQFIREKIDDLSG